MAEFKWFVCVLVIAVSASNSTARDDPCGLPEPAETGSGASVPAFSLVCGIQEVPASAAWDFAVCSTSALRSDAGPCIFRCRAAATCGSPDWRGARPSCWPLRDRVPPTTADWYDFVTYLNSPCSNASGPIGVRYFKRTNPAGVGYAYNLFQLTQAPVVSMVVRSGVPWALYDNGPNLDLIGYGTIGRTVCSGYYQLINTFSGCTFTQANTLFVGNPGENASHTPVLGQYSLRVGDEVSVVSIDLAATRVENAASHHTDYYWGLHAMSDAPSLAGTQILRRAAVARFKAVVSSTLDLACHDLSLDLSENYTGGTNSIRVPPVTQVPPPQQWGLRVVQPIANQPGTNNKLVTFDLYIPNTAPIGQYRTTLNVEARGTGRSLAQRVFPGPVEGQIVLLFNSWSPNDDVSFGPQSAIDAPTEAHVRRTTEVVFRPTGLPPNTQLNPIAWNVMPQQGGVLQEALNALAGLGAVGRASPISVSRHLVTRVNGRNSGGILWGKWRTASSPSQVSPSTGPIRCESPSTHVDPLTPTELAQLNNVPGTRALLGRWITQYREPLRLAQCWMYAGLTCSFHRTLGIPCRIVSGEEVVADWGGHFGGPSDGKVTHFFKTIPSVNVQVRDICREHDWIWNYHVWNEVWMRRPDIAAYPGSGWQLIDATPVHAVRPSRYVLANAPAIGPAAIAAVQLGGLGTPFDAKAVYSLRNAYYATKIVQSATGMDSPPMRGDRTFVGAGAFTDARPMFAAVSLNNPPAMNRRDNYATPVPPPLIGESQPWFQVPQWITPGSDLEVVLHLSNESEAPRIINYHVDFCRSVFGGGNSCDSEVRPSITSSITLATGESTDIPIIVAWTAIAAQTPIDPLWLVATAVWGEGEDEMMATDRHVYIEQPKLLSAPAAGQSHPTGVVSLTLELAEPLAIPLTNVVLRVSCTNEYALLAEGQHTVELVLGDLPAGAVVSRTLIMRSVLPGEAVVMSWLSADQVYMVNSAFSVEIGGCPGDFDDSGTLGPEDIFTFLAVWFAESSQPCAWGLASDVNGDGCSTLQDLFAFLANYFAECQ